MSHMNTSHFLRRDTSQDRAKWQNFTSDSCHTYDMMWHDSNMCTARHDSFIHKKGETRLIHTYERRDMTHQVPHVWHDALICKTWPIQIRDMTHSNIWMPRHDSSMSTWWENTSTMRAAAWLVSNPFFFWSVIHLRRDMYAFEWVRSHVWMGHISHTNESCLTWEWVM